MGFLEYHIRIQLTAPLYHKSLAGYSSIFNGRKILYEKKFTVQQGTTEFNHQEERIFNFYIRSF